MLIKEIPEIIALFEPASEQQIMATEKSLDVCFPVEYKSLLRQSNGVVADLVQLYPVEDLVERNETYEVSEYSPSYILIGSVNGFPVLIKSGNESGVFGNDWGLMTPDCMNLVGVSIVDWISKGCPDS